MTPKSRGSRRVGEAFRVAAGERRHRVVEEVPLPGLIDMSALATHFTEEDISAAREQRFDFALLSSEGKPLIVLEFDGPCHASAAKQRADIRKHRACWIANLQIR